MSYTTYINKGEKVEETALMTCGLTSLASQINYYHTRQRGRATADILSTATRASCLSPQADNPHARPTN